MLDLKPRTLLEAVSNSLIGKVSDRLEASVSLRIIGGLEVTAIVDTGFDGSLILPSAAVEELGLPFLWREFCVLADGTKSEAGVVSAQVEWLGEVRRIEVVVMETCLVGTQLLAGTRLTIDYEAGSVLIEKK